MDPVTRLQDPASRLQDPTSRLQDPAPRLQPTSWGQFLHRIYLQEHRAPPSEPQDLVGDNGAEDTPIQDPWMELQNLQPLSQDTLQDNKDPQSYPSPQEKTLTNHSKDLQGIWLK